MALELVTYADLKKLLDLEDAAITDYPGLEVINGTMIVAFEEYLGRKLDNVARTDTQYVGGFLRRQLSLPGIPVTAVASVTVYRLGEDELWTENTQYEIASYGLRIMAPLRNMKIVTVYTGGLSAVTEEPNLNRAALYQIAFEFQNKEWIGSESVSTEGGSVTKPGLKLLDETKRMLNSSVHPLRTRK